MSKAEDSRKSTRTKSQPAAQESGRKRRAAADAGDDSTGAKRSARSTEANKEDGPRLRGCAPTTSSRSASPHGSVGRARHPQEQESGNGVAISTTSSSSSNPSAAGSGNSTANSGGSTEQGCPEDEDARRILEAEAALRSLTGGLLAEEPALGDVQPMFENLFEKKDPTRQTGEACQASSTSGSVASSWKDVVTLSASSSSSGSVPGGSPMRSPLSPPAPDSSPDQPASHGTPKASREQDESMDTETSRGDSTGDGLAQSANPSHQDTGKDNRADEDSGNIELDTREPAAESSRAAFPAASTPVHSSSSPSSSSSSSSTQCPATPDVASTAATVGSSQSSCSSPVTSSTFPAASTAASMAYSAAAEFGSAVATRGRVDAYDVESLLKIGEECGSMRPIADHPHFKVEDPSRKDCRHAGSNPGVVGGGLAPRGPPSPPRGVSSGPGLVFGRGGIQVKHEPKLEPLCFSDCAMQQQQPQQQQQHHHHREFSAGGAYSSPFGTAMAEVAPEPARYAVLENKLKEPLKPSLGYGAGEEERVGAHLVPLPDDDRPLVIDESRLRLEESDDDDSNSRPPLLDSPQRTPDGSLKGNGVAISTTSSSSSNPSAAGSGNSTANSGGSTEQGCPEDEDARRILEAEAALRSLTGGLLAEEPALGDVQPMFENLFEKKDPTRQTGEACQASSTSGSVASSWKDVVTLSASSSSSGSVPGGSPMRSPLSPPAPDSSPDQPASHGTPK
ncbi:myelin transcription factor 1-like protein [Ixodes scapularis]